VWRGRTSRVAIRGAVRAVAFDAPGFVAAARALTLAADTAANTAMIAVVRRSRRSARSRRATSAGAAWRSRADGVAMGPLSAPRVGAG
jgi:hypothetical protein